MTAAHFFLRPETADAHDVVDRAFSRFDLARAEDYRAFLIAHARVLAPLEPHLATASQLPSWRPRMPLLASDLARLNATIPAPTTIEGLGHGAELLGALYVIEGSRLGGGLLARRVGQGLPRDYLSAVHLPGEWRTLLATLDAAASTASAREAMVIGARYVFELYANAAKAAETAV